MVLVYCTVVQNIANTASVIKALHINACNFFPHAAVDDKCKDDEPKLDQLSISTTSVMDISCASNINSNESGTTPNIEIAAIESCVGSVDESSSNMSIATYGKATCSKVEASVLDDVNSSHKDEILHPKSRTPSPKASPKKTPSRKVSEAKEGKL